MNLSFNIEKIYENASFNINYLDKVGIVGVNGAGKTTLFKVIMGKLKLDSGRIILPKNTNIGYLPQEIELEDKEMTVFDYLMTARPIKKLENEITCLYEKITILTDEREQNKLLKKIAEKQDLLEYYDFYKAEDIMLEIIENMNIDTNLIDMKLKNLSGGEKSKIAFAHLLYSKPELILLDEPTNHLDLQTRNYIISYLKNYKGTVLIISHDISFLDSIINKTLHIDKATHKINVYVGNYTDFSLKLKREKEIKERLIDKQEKEETKLRDFILQYSNSSGKRKRIAQSREKMLDKKIRNRIEKDIVYKKVKLNLKPNNEGSKIPMKVNNLNFNYKDKDKIINNLSFLINNKERFLIVGKNGVGKSTLLKLIVGKLKPNDGNIWFGSKTQLVYYAQEQEILDLNKTIIENVNSNEYSEKELRTILGSFLFYGDDVFKKVNILSPGEKARVSLCKIMIAKANLIILDEPTNHLDPETQKIIGENFKKYDGTILLVSHNSSFVESIGIDRMLILPSGKISNYSSDVLKKYEDQNS